MHSLAVTRYLRPSVQFISDTGNLKHPIAILTKRCLWVTRSLVSATCLCIHNLRKEGAGCMLSFDCRHTTIWPWSGVSIAIPAPEHTNRVVKIKTCVCFVFGTGETLCGAAAVPGPVISQVRSRNDISLADLFARINQSHLYGYFVWVLCNSEMTEHIFLVFGWTR